MEIIIFPVVTRGNRGKPKKYSKFQNAFFVCPTKMFSRYFFYSRNLFPIKHDDITLSRPTFPVTRGWKTNCTPFTERIRVRVEPKLVVPAQHRFSWPLSSTGHIIPRVEHKTGMERIKGMRASVQRTETVVFSQWTDSIWNITTRDCRLHK